MHLYVYTYGTSPSTLHSANAVLGHYEEAFLPPLKSIKLTGSYSSCANLWAALCYADVKLRIVCWLPPQPEAGVLEGICPLLL